MILTPHLILIVLALLFAVLSMVWTQYPLLSVAVILLAIAAFVPK